MTRGRLRIYFGVAPGVGKTFAMLNEGWRRKQRGADVVIGYFEDHGRPETNAQLRDLEIVPSRHVDYRGQAFEELDIQALILRRPEVVLVDELAHTNAPGSRNAKRWEDIDELLDAGIDVITTVNVQHLESLNDVVERITGVRQRETVPDAFVRGADQIELVDMSPEALRRRMAHGNIYPPDKIDAALGNYFRIGNLTALRELTLLWVADRVDEALQEYRERHGIQDVWDTREKIVVALTSAPGEEEVVRRAARSALRNKARLVGIHVRSDDGLRSSHNEHLTRYVDLLKEFGGTYREVTGTNIARTLVGAARAENATQLFMGESDRSRWSETIRGSVVTSAVRYSGSGLDVHVISTLSLETDRGQSWQFRAFDLAPLSSRRQTGAFALVLLGLPILTIVLTSMRSRLGLQSCVLLYLMFSVLVGSIGGVWPAIIGTAAAFIVLDFYFTAPIHKFTISSSQDVIALLAFAIIAGTVSVLVDIAARRSADGNRARNEAQGLARMAATMLSRHDPLPELMEDILATFQLEGVSLLVPTTSGWSAEVTAGPSPPTSAVEGDNRVVISLSPSAQLVASGGRLDAEDGEILRSFGNQLGVALETRRLQRESEAAAALARSNELRTALLSAVSHDLRTPLASIKAASSSLLSPNMSWEQGEERALIQTIDTEADRLNDLVADLLDMSRIRTGALVVQSRPTSVDEVMAALLDVLPTGKRIEIHVPEDLPLIQVDPVLLQRVLVNITENALSFSPDDKHVHVSVGQVLDRVHFRVIDFGPGISEEERERVFRPFQRLGDVPNGRGVGLGMAVARGFVEAMSGELEIDATPGGGTTMVVSVPAVSQ